MKDVIILTGISPRTWETANNDSLKGAIRDIKISALSALTGIRRNSLAMGLLAGALCFFGILFGFEIFGSIMGIVSLLALSQSEKGGAK